MRTVVPSDSFLAHVRHAAIPCPSCGHSLRETTNGACSECGAEATLPAIIGSRPRAIAPIPWFIAAAVAFLHLPTSLERWQYFGWGHFPYFNRSILDPAIHTLMKIASTSFWLLVPPAVFLFLMGAQLWFARRSPRVQWTMAIGAVAFTVLTHRRWILNAF